MFKRATYCFLFLINIFISFFFYVEEKTLIWGKSLTAANFLDILNGIQEENVCKAVTQKYPIQQIL